MDFDDVIADTTTSTSTTTTTTTTTASNRHNNNGETKIGCKQCGKKTFESDLQPSPYPKQRFNINQNYNNSIAGATRSKYLVCNDCYRFPKCISCKCKFKNAGEKFLCSQCMEFGAKWEKFDENLWKCQNCRDRESTQRKIREDNHNNNNITNNIILSNTVPNSNIRNMLRSPSVKENDFIEVEGWGLFSPFQWLQLWHVSILHKFQVDFGRGEIQDIQRFVGGNKPIHSIVDAINLLQKNKKWLVKNFLIGGTKYGIDFCRVCLLAGSKDCWNVTDNVPTQPSILTAIIKIQKRYKFNQLKKKYPYAIQVLEKHYSKAAVKTRKSEAYKHKRLRSNPITSAKGSALKRKRE